MEDRDLEFFECTCHTPDHLIKFNLDKEDGDLSLYVQINHYKNFFKRLIAAFKYIFKIKHNDTHWDCFILNLKDTDRLIEFLQKSKQIQEEKLK